MCRNADEEKGLGRPAYSAHFSHSMARDATNVSQFFTSLFFPLTVSLSGYVCLSQTTRLTRQLFWCFSGCRAVGFYKQDASTLMGSRFMGISAPFFLPVQAFMAKEGRVIHYPRLLIYICLYLMLTALQTLNGRHSVLHMKTVMSPSYNSNELNFQHYLNHATPSVLNI